MTQILFCGSREWTDYWMIHDEIKYILRQCPDLVVIEGGAPGADQMAAKAARAVGVPPERHITVPAQWYKHGYYNAGAGHERNLQMLDMLGEGDYVIAFHDGISGGTAHTIKNALKRKIPTLVYYPDGRYERHIFSDSST